MHPEVDRWMRLGPAVGLVAHAPSTSCDRTASFGTLTRAMGLPTAHDDAGSFDTWFHGVRHGVEVLVMSYPGKLGSEHAWSSATVARIDPPLLLGLVARGSAPAAPLHLHARDRDRAADLLARADTDGLPFGARIARLAADGLEVRDSTVSLARPAMITDPGKLVFYLDACIDLARALASCRASLPPTPDRVAQQAEWRRFADATDARADSVRMVLDGRIHGATYRIALEMVEHDDFTTVMVQWPEALKLAFRVETARSWSHVPFGRRFLLGGVIVGDPAFDNAFRVTGHPEAAVREMLRRPALLDLLVGLARETDAIALDHTGLFFRVRGLSPTVAHLDALVRVARVATTALFGARSSASPYR